MPDSERRFWRLGLKISKFAAYCAADLFIPDWITKPVTYIKKFHQTFLCTTLQDRLTLFAEAEMITEANRQEVIDVMVEEFREQVPPQTTDAQLRDFCGKILDSLREANETEKQGGNSTKKLQQSLSRSFLTNEPLRTEKSELSNQQQQIAKSRISAVLQGLPKTKANFVFNPSDLPKLLDYEFLQAIGEGGFARVYKALHRPTNEFRAIKIGEINEPDRFDRELKLVESLNDSHLLKYHEHGKFNADKNYWIAMDYLGEQTLEDLMRAPEFSNETENIILISEQILLGLKALHKAGIVHRDVKPSNIMFGADNRVKLIDFGLAKPLEQLPDMLSTKSIGKMIGTPFYMSPEQLKATLRPTTASDLYSFAIVVTEMFTRNNPNSGASLAEVILKACAVVPNLSGTNVPSELHSLLTECLQLDPKNRPENASLLIPKWQSVTEPLHAKIRFEKDRESWLKVFDENLILYYLNDCVKKNEQSSANGFNHFLSQKNINPIRQQRLEEVLPTLLNAFEEILAANKKLKKTKNSFAEDASKLSSSQMMERSQEVQNAENFVAEKKREFKLLQQRVLEKETKTWQAHLDEQARLEEERQIRIRHAKAEERRLEKEREERLEAEKQEKVERLKVQESRTQRLKSAKKKEFFDNLVVIFIFLCLVGCCGGCVTIGVNSRNYLAISGFVATCTIGLIGFVFFTNKSDEHHKIATAHDADEEPPKLKSPSRKRN